MYRVNKKKYYAGIVIGILLMVLGVVLLMKFSGTLAYIAGFIVMAIGAISILWGCISLYRHRRPTLELGPSTNIYSGVCPNCSAMVHAHDIRCPACGEPLH